MPTAKQICVSYANRDLQTVKAQDTPMPPPRKWMMPVALSMVMLSALGWIEGTT